MEIRSLPKPIDLESEGYVKITLPSIEVVEEQIMLDRLFAAAVAAQARGEL